MQKSPEDKRFEFVVLAGMRARQLMRGAVPREAGEKRVMIARLEVLRRKVEKIEDESS